jgi:hypothetical protein
MGRCQKTKLSEMFRSIKSGSRSEELGDGKVAIDLVNVVELMVLYINSFSFNRGVLLYFLV